MTNMRSAGVPRGRRAPRGQLRPTSEQFRTANSIATFPPGISVTLFKIAQFKITFIENAKFNISISLGADGISISIARTPLLGRQ